MNGILGTIISALLILTKFTHELQKPPDGLILKREGQCAGDKSEFVIGFEEPSKAFNKIMLVCFDEGTSLPLYAIHKLRPGTTGLQKDGYKMNFNKGGLFSNISMNVSYNRKHQLHVFSRLLSESAAKNYIYGANYYVRGHLVPRGDFVNDAHQAATFYYVNTAPQWRAFNNGNWARLEISIRKFVIERRRMVTVYTGTYKTFEINGQKMFLTYNSSWDYKIPIPQIIWKVVYDEKKERAVAFVGLNTPWTGNLNDNPAKKMCSNDVCHLLSWVHFRRIPGKGLIYCCEFDKFARAMGTFPPIGYVDGVLVG